MTDFAKAWQLSRHRFAESVSDLNQEQLNFRLHPDVLTAGEMVLPIVLARANGVVVLVEGGEGDHPGVGQFAGDDLGGRDANAVIEAMRIYASPLPSNLTPWWPAKPGIANAIFSEPGTDSDGFIRFTVSSRFQRSENSIRVFAAKQLPGDAEIQRENLQSMGVVTARL